MPSGGELRLASDAMRLTPEQIRRFHVDGFLSITDPIASTEELEWLRGIYDRLFASRAGREEGNQFDLAGPDEDGVVEALPQILDPARYAPELLNGKFLSVSNEIVRDLFGPEAQVGIAHAIFKPAGTGAPTPWHQDEAYWDPSRQYRSVSVWMPLQEATVENGCLWFVPGSHEWDVLPHRSIGGDVRVHGLEMVDTSVTESGIPCPLPAGGITIHRNRTAHYSGPNVSGTPRRALIMMGGLPDAEHLGDRSFPWNEAKQTARSERAQLTEADSR